MPIPPFLSPPLLDKEEGQRFKERDEDEKDLRWKNSTGQKSGKVEFSFLDRAIAFSRAI